MGRTRIRFAGRTSGSSGAWLLVTLCLLTPLFAGCVENEGGDEDPGEESPAPTPTGKRSLAALTECKGEYRDSDVPVRCENEIEELEPVSDVSLDGWSCRGEFPENSDREGMRLYRNDTHEQDALDYWQSFNVSVLGIVAITPADGGDVQYMNWNAGGVNATIRLPALETGDRFDVLMFTIPFETNTPPLLEAEARVNWSLHEDAAYPVRILVTEHHHYFFPQTIGMPDDEVFPYQWGPIHDNYSTDTMDASGSDYRVVFHHYQFFRETLTVPAPGEADC